MRSKPGLGSWPGVGYQLNLSAPGTGKLARARPTGSLFSGWVELGYKNVCLLECHHKSHFLNTLLHNSLAGSLNKHYSQYFIISWTDNCVHTYCPYPAFNAFTIFGHSRKVLGQNSCCGTVMVLTLGRIHIPQRHSLSLHCNFQNLLQVEQLKHMWDM